MPRLILLNGPPAVGKSTIARLFVEDHPLSLNLDIDRFRDLIGGWQEHRQAGLLTQAIALAAARTHLLAGYDVMIPQYLGRVASIEQLEAVALEVDADFHELVVLDAKDGALRRFADRSQASAEPAHRQAQQMLERNGGAAELAAMYDRLIDIIAVRPGVKIVASEEGRPGQTYRRVLRALA